MIPSFIRKAWFVVCVIVDVISATRQLFSSVRKALSRERSASSSGKDSGLDTSNEN